MPIPSKQITLEELVDWLKTNGYRNVEVAKGYPLEELIRDLDRLDDLMRASENY
jgi:sugar phosphate isomerase/epimerase